MKETPEHLHRGGRVWAPSLQVPGTWQLSSVVGPSSDGGVRLRPLNEYGEDRSLPPSELLPANPPMMDAAADLTSLTYLNAPSVLDVLRTRARQGDIYSSAGPVLVAVNPLRDIPGLYGEERMEDYRLGRQSLRPPRAVGATGGTSQADGVGGAASQADAPPSSAPAPHVYGVAEAAYRDLCEGRGSQSILITGESGAGKTETTKHALRYISRVAGSSRRGLERAVLGSNPLLEAFGNASTQHNANSSRFGKLISLRFDAARRVTSACVDAYLLEKSRVVAHLPGERAFHVFYQMCAGATVDERARWRLPPSAAAFAYLCGPGAPFPSRADDAPAFAELRRAMEALDLDFERQDAIFQLLAGILWLGNVQFEACGDGDRASAATPTSHAAKASSPRPSTPAAGASPKAHPTADAGGRVIPASCPALELAAGLLGLDARALEEALTWRRMRVGAESLRLPRGVRGAGDARDALAKGLYASLFEWLVSRVNAVLLRGGREADEGAAAEEIPSGPSLSILDIYGFECFGVNSLEQLCINLANERLQQHFNDCLCAAEQETYAREGVEWRRIDWEDNADVIALLLARPPQPAGVLALLDEECLFPGGSDASFAAKLAQLLTGHPRFLTPGRGSVSRSPSLDPSRGSGSPALAPALSPMLPGSALPLPATSPPAARSFRRSRAGPGGPRTPRSPAAEAARQPAGDFAVRHTAGEVAYCCGGFLDKNRDALPPELGALLAASGAPLVALLSADLASDASDRRVGGSLAVRFREQLEALIRTLRATRPRFVRCVRPNASQARGVWEDALVLRQLRCCGVMEVVRIAAAGFPTRYRHARFAAMYAPLLAGGADRLRRCVGEAEGWGDGEADQEIPPPPMKPSSPELLELCADVLRRFGVERGDYQVGRSLLLFRPGVLGALESRAQRARRAAVVVQACWRGSRARRQLRVARGAAAALQAAWRGVLARREALARRRRRDAALALQAAWRACLAKKALRRLRMELQERRRREEEAKRVEEEARRAEEEARRAEERARRSEERARRSEEELARREASEAAAAMRVHSNPLAEEEEEEDAAEGDAASSVAALQAALEASEAHRAALARQLRDSRAESELLRRALRTLGDEEDPAPAGAAGVKPEAPADPLSPPSPSQPPPGAVAPQRIRAAVLDAAARGGAADGAESPAATSTASSQTPSSSQVGVGWAAAARSGSQRAESDGNGGVSGASGVAASLGAELARKGSLFDDDASFIVEVFRGEAAAPGMDPGAELAQLRQRYALWKAGFKARLQEAERALRGEGRKGRKRGEEAAGRKESFLGRVLQRGAKATAVAQ